MTGPEGNSEFCSLPTQKSKKKKTCENRLLYANLPRFQGARPDHVRVESSSWCFPRELLSFVRPKELESLFDPPHVTHCLPIGKRIELGGITANV